MKHFFKSHWKKALSAFAVPAAFAAGMQAQMPLGAQLDSKGEDVKVCVEIKEPNYHDRMCYLAADWETKSEQDIKREKQDRIDKFKKHVRSSSLLETPPDALIE